MTPATEVIMRPGVLRTWMGALRTLIIGGLLCLSAPTSLVALGWFMRRMRFLARNKAELVSDAPGWVMGEGSGLRRLLGGLAANIREGAYAALSLVLATMPFSLVWLFSWWGGWENSFTKGYEQAFVGPSLGLASVMLFCLVMIWLPMALAHQAVENKAFAFFEWRRVRSAVRHTGWAYVFLAIATVLLSLPVFASRGLVAFASGIVPGFDTMTAEEVAALAGRIDLALAFYVFASFSILRAWSACIYATAVSRAVGGPDAAIWMGAALDTARRMHSRPWKLTHWLRNIMLAVIWFGLAAQIYVAQFLNHDWHLWLTHPVFLLPWAG